MQLPASKKGTEGNRREQREQRQQREQKVAQNRGMKLLAALAFLALPQNLWPVLNAGSARRFRTFFPEMSGRFGG